jgi:hypothetical protein
MKQNTGWSRNGDGGGVVVGDNCGNGSGGFWAAKLGLWMRIQFRLLSTKGLDSKHGPLDNCPKECGIFE